MNSGKEVSGFAHREYTLVPNLMLLMLNMQYLLNYRPNLVSCNPRLQLLTKQHVPGTSTLKSIIDLSPKIRV